MKAGNYRPISLTSISCMILEAIVRENMIEFLNKNSIITILNQHEFLEGKSCLTILLETFEDWTTTLDEGYGLDIIYLDYKKAFDTIPHCRLIKKLEAYDIQGKVAQWVEAFLSGSEGGPQRIKVRVGPCPEWCPPGVGLRSDTLHIIREHHPRPGPLQHQDVCR